MLWTIPSFLLSPLFYNSKQSQLIYKREVRAEMKELSKTQNFNLLRILEGMEKTWR